MEETPLNIAQQENQIEVIKLLGEEVPKKNESRIVSIASPPPTAAPALVYKDFDDATREKVLLNDKRRIRKKR